MLGLLGGHGLKGLSGSPTEAQASSAKLWEVLIFRVKFECAQACGAGDPSLRIGVGVVGQDLWAKSKATGWGCPAFRSSPMNTSLLLELERGSVLLTLGSISARTALPGAHGPFSRLHLLQLPPGKKSSHCPSQELTSSMS